MTQPITIGNAVLNLEAQTLHVEGEEVHLTTFEYRTLKHLMEFQHRLLPAAEIEEVLYPGQRAASNVLQVIIGRIRRKLYKADVNWRIDTIRGRGYRIDAPADGGVA